MDKELVQKFIMDPEWRKMQEFIEQHFETNTDIHSIDTTLSPETVHAQVIAQQEIDRKIKGLKAVFENLRMQATKKPTTFK